MFHLIWSFFPSIFFRASELTSITKFELSFLSLNKNFGKTSSSSRFNYGFCSVIDCFILSMCITSGTLYSIIRGFLNFAPFASSSLPDFSLMLLHITSTYLLLLDSMSMFPFLSALKELTPTLISVGLTFSLIRDFIFSVLWLFLALTMTLCHFLMHWISASAYPLYATSHLSGLFSSFHFYALKCFKTLLEIVTRIASHWRDPTYSSKYYDCRHAAVELV